MNKNRPFTIEERSFSYVIIVPQGQYQLNIDPNKLSKVFGKFGTSSFTQVPNGFLVQLGPENQLLVQFPKVEFKAANEEMLFELYQNAYELLMEQLPVKAANAFGINFVTGVKFNDMDNKEVLQRLSSNQLPINSSVTRILLRKSDALNNNILNVDIGISETHAEELQVNFNHHIPEPGKAGLPIADLKNEIENMRNRITSFLEEIHTSIQIQI